MKKSTRFFRYVWRINGIVLLLAAVVITLAVGTLLAGEIGRMMNWGRQANQQLLGPRSNDEPDLKLGDASLVEGTSVMRAELQQSSEGAKFSSGYSSETRNILFIEPGQKAASWLLPDNAHIIGDTQDIKDNKTSEKKVVATVVVVNSTTDPAEVAGGRLLLFDPAGRNVIEVAKNVHKLHVASASGSELTLLFERNQRFVLAAFDARSLSKVREQEIEVPRIAK